MALNHVILHGNLTRDIDLRKTKSGKTVGNIGLAVNEKWTDSEGQRVTQTVFVNCTAWGVSAEVLAEYLRKGDPIIIQGRLRMEEWNDKETGKDMRTLSVTVETFTFCGAKKQPVQEDGTPPATRSVQSFKTAPRRA